MEHRALARYRGVPIDRRGVHKDSPGWYANLRYFPYPERTRMVWAEREAGRDNRFVGLNSCDPAGDAIGRWLLIISKRSFGWRLQNSAGNLRTLNVTSHRNGRRTPTIRSIQALPVMIVGWNNQLVTQVAAVYSRQISILLRPHERGAYYNEQA